MPHVVSESMIQAWGDSLSPQVCHTGAPCWHGASGRWQLRWALRYVLTQLLVLQVHFLIRTHGKMGVLGAMSWHSVEWRSVVVSILSEPRALLSSSLDVMELVLIFSWAQTLLLPYVLRTCRFELEPNDEMYGPRWLSAGDTGLSCHISSQLSWIL